jgi:hypothetical protein
LMLIIGQLYLEYRAANPRSACRAGCFIAPMTILVRWCLRKRPRLRRLGNRPSASHDDELGHCEFSRSKRRA